MKWNFIPFLIVFACWFASCESQDAGSSRSGILSLLLKTDTTSLNKGVSSGLTKASLADEFASFTMTDDYAIRIMQDDDTIKSYTRFDEMPLEITLPQGVYTVIASKGDDEPAAFSNPYFEGSSDFTIKEDMTTPLEVTATLANARVTADFTDDFKEAYSDYTVLLGTTYTSSDLEIVKGETRPAYVQVSEKGTEMRVGIRLKKVTEEEEQTLWVSNNVMLQRRQNVHLIFKTNGSALEGIGVQILLDDELEEVTLTTEIPDFMWQQFDKPTLTPYEFENGEKFVARAGNFKDDIQVGVVMKGGIGSLLIKYWKEDEVEEDAICYDLATDQGVADAIKQYYTWTVGNDKDVNLFEKTAAQLYLKSAILSLEPMGEDKSCTYNFSISGFDATGKSYASNTLSFTVGVLPAEAPIVTAEGEDASIVEGDELAADWTIDFTATGQIDKEATKVVVSDGTTEDSYYFMKDNGESLKSAFGVTTTNENSAYAALSFPKAFAASLPAPDEGAKTYTFTFYLKDKQEKEYTLTKTITVSAPEFELISTDGDAFAKRVVLRVEMPVGSPDKLSFQYKTSVSDWIDYAGKMVQDGTQYVDTLKGLTETTNYQIRVLYKGAKIWEGNNVEVMTEKALPLEDGSFENWHSQQVYSHKTAWVGIDIYQWWPFNEGEESWWATRNALTNSQNEGTTCYYTSFSGTVPIDDGYKGKAAEISSLGYGKGSTYSRTAGWDAKKRAAGMLFIGTHTATPGGDTETFNYGHEFDSRPIGFKFYYKFKSINSESFRAYVVVENRDLGVVTELGRGELVSNLDQNSFIEARVDIKYSNTSLKATHMYIVFISSTSSNPKLEVVTGSVGEIGGNTDSRFVGNVLTVDEVELIYE